MMRNAAYTHRLRAYGRGRKKLILRPCLLRTPTLTPAMSLVPCTNETQTHSTPSGRSKTKPPSLRPLMARRPMRTHPEGRIEHANMALRSKPETTASGSVEKPTRFPCTEFGEVGHIPGSFEGIDVSDDCDTNNHGIS